MDAVLSKCGNNCARCPSYKDNLLTVEDRGNCSQGWHTYHGFRLAPEKLISCDGCQPVGENGNGTRYINCLIRRCALHNQVQNCAYCSAYPCQTLTDRVLGKEWLADLTARFGKISDDDFELYVEPYLALPHLDALRGTLGPGEIIPITPVSLEPRLAAYPRELEDAPGSGSVFNLIQALNAPLKGLSYAQAEKTKETRSHILKLLWSFARFGEFNEDESALTLDHQVYLAQKIHSNYQRVQTYFDVLDAHGLHCEVIPLKEDRWLTPTGALRRQGVRELSPPWLMVMNAEDGIGGARTLMALQTYATALSAAYGKTAYRRFARADLSVLCA